MTTMMRKRRSLIAGNWKMNLTHIEGAALVLRLISELRADNSGLADVDLVVCPPFTALDAVGGALAVNDTAVPVALGAQDMHWQQSGAFTGEISAEMLRALNCTYVILGHSERRHQLGETDEQVGRKVAAALAAGLTPVVCVGETLAERQDGQAETVVARQLEALPAALGSGAGRIVVAYEPVWAIGTGVAAAPDDAEAMAEAIRRRLAAVDERLAAATRVVYGGSVTPDNAGDFLQLPNIDGALVGGASLNAESFAAIARAAVAW